MVIQVVNFNLKNMTDGEYRKWCDELAPTFGSMPGLISKVWLADPATNTYGGVYTWRDRSAYEAWVKSELFQAGGKPPNLPTTPAGNSGGLKGRTRISHGPPAVPA